MRSSPSFLPLTKLAFSLAIRRLHRPQPCALSRRVFRRDVCAGSAGSEGLLRLSS